MNSHLRLRCLAAKVLCFGIVLLPALSSAGTFAWNSGSWVSVSGTGSGDASSYVADPSTNAFFPSLTLQSGTSSQNYNLSGTYNYSITWTPSSASDPVPNSVTVTFNVAGLLSAFGTGVASITQGTTQLYEMDSSNDVFAGYGTMLYQWSVSLPVVLQANGTYIASGSFSTDKLATTWNSGTGGTTSATEAIGLFSMTGNF